MSRQSIPRPGDIINGQFVLRREIGRGSMGVVFEAHQTTLERRVAVKMLLPDALRQTKVVDRFKREARMASSLNHPNLVTIHGFGTEPLPFIIMEFLEGEDLRDYLSRQGLLRLDETVQIMAQALAGIGLAHKKGIIHRDIKPENIYLAASTGRDRVVKVLDFGIARAVTANWGTMVERLTGTGMACGTPHYMAPEQLRGADDMGSQADVYSLGCVIYELLTGRPPFDGMSPVDIALKHVDAAPPPLLDEYAGTHIEYVIYRALAKNASARFDDANAMLAELRRCVQYQPVEQPADSALPSYEWSRETIKVPEGIERVRELQAAAQVGARVELPPSVVVSGSIPRLPRPFETEPDTDPESPDLPTAIQEQGALMAGAIDNGVPEHLVKTRPPIKIPTDPVFLPMTGSGERTMPVPSLAALPEGETWESFRHKVTHWEPNTRPKLAIKNREEEAPAAARSGGAVPRPADPAATSGAPRRPGGANPSAAISQSPPRPEGANRRLGTETSEVNLSRANAAINAREQRAQRQQPAPAPAGSPWLWIGLSMLALFLVAVIALLVVLIALNVV